MKFIVTGNIRSSHGPRNIIVFTYLLFFLFLISNFYLMLNNLSFSYDEFVKLLEPSLVLRLEDLHIKLFLFGMYLLFNLAMLYQVRLKLKFKNLLFFITLILFIFFLFSLIYYSTDIWFFYFYIFAVIGFHMYLIFFQLILVWDIYKK